MSEASDARDRDWLKRNGYDPEPDLKKITAPFLAFYGGRDWVVPPEENVKRLESSLTAAGNRDFKVVTIPGADHDLAFPDTLRRLPAERDRPERYYWVWGRVSPLYIDLMLEWVLKRVTVVK